MSMSAYTRVCLVIGAVGLSLGGCGEVSIQRGGTPRELEQARAFCQENEGVFASLSACLEDQGWTSFGGSEAPEDEVDRQAAQTTSGGTEGSVAPEESDDGAITFGTTDKRLGLFPITEESVSENKKPVDMPSTESKAKAKAGPINPTAEVFVNSWWKMGANGEALLRDGDACLETLGDGYSASGNFSRLSYGVLQCLRQKGWRYSMAR